MGLIAQEVEQVFHNWIGVDAGGYKTLTTRGFEALIIEAIRELTEENRRLATKHLELESRINALA